jgi:hypothetical protein
LEGLNLALVITLMTLEGLNLALVITLMTLACSRRRDGVRTWCPPFPKSVSVNAPKLPRMAQLLALIMQKDGVRRILALLGLPCEPPVIMQARALTLIEDPRPPADWDAA